MACTGLYVTLENRFYATESQTMRYGRPTLATAGLLVFFSRRHRGFIAGVFCRKGLCPTLLIDSFRGRGFAAAAAADNDDDDDVTVSQNAAVSLRPTRSLCLQTAGS